jgi:SH3 domain-containing YSC84-like protein 1
MKRRRQTIYRFGACFVITVFVVVIILSVFRSAFAASDAGEAQGIVDKARVTYNGFIADKNYTYLHKNLKYARGLLIYPQVLKAGFFLGGSGGTGVLLVRNVKTGDWSQPAFYTLGSVTFGLQIGGEAAEVVMMVMTQKALDTLYVSSFKLGADTSVAVGPVGAGAKGDITADFISFAKSKGLYAGLNFEGSVIDVRDGLNNVYYGKAVRPIDIMVKNEVGNKGSAGLREVLKNAAR